MSDSTIEHLSEQLRAQGLTWGQTNFAVSLLRAEIDRLRDELAHYKEAATKLSAETYDLEAELTASREREARMRGALDEIAWGRAPGPLNNKLAQKYEQVAVAALAEGSPQ